LSALDLDLAETDQAQLGLELVKDADLGVDENEFDLALVRHRPVGGARVGRVNDSRRRRSRGLFELLLADFDERRGRAAFRRGDVLDSRCPGADDDGEVGLGADRERFDECGREKIGCRGR
jgi:hypothetical protein